MIELKALLELEILRQHNTRLLYRIAELERENEEAKRVIIEAKRIIVEYTKTMAETHRTHVEIQDHLRNLRSKMESNGWTFQTS